MNEAADKSPGKKDVTVIFNGRAKVVEKDFLTFAEIVALSFDNPPTGDGVDFTIQYTKGHSGKPKGLWWLASRSRSTMGWSSMSRRPIARSPDLQRLRQDGYDLECKGAYLLIKDIPYANAQRQIKRGILISGLELADDATKKPETHVTY